MFGKTPLDALENVRRMVPIQKGEKYSINLDGVWDKVQSSIPEHRPEQNYFICASKDKAQHAIAIKHTHINKILMRHLLHLPGREWPQCKRRENILDCKTNHGKVTFCKGFVIAHISVEEGKEGEIQCSVNEKAEKLSNFHPRAGDRFGINIYGLRFINLLCGLKTYMETNEEEFNRSFQRSLKSGSVYEDNKCISCRSSHILAGWVNDFQEHVCLYCAGVTEWKELNGLELQLTIKRSERPEKMFNETAGAATSTTYQIVPRESLEEFGKLMHQLELAEKHCISQLRCQKSLEAHLLDLLEGKCEALSKLKVQVPEDDIPARITEQELAYNLKLYSDNGTTCTTKGGYHLQNLDPQNGLATGQ